ncbi:MAG: hypothetical protein QOE33_919 [Acidobacteriota bacterium]|nr:hypothetical protein [Acidobacteriota bacterium]
MLDANEAAVQTLDAAPPQSAGARSNGPPPDAGTQVSDRAWWIGCAVVLFVAALFRVLYLELKPLHHDEGVNGFFLLGLLRQGSYQYNPGNYHGPTLYYFTLPIAYLAESRHALGTWALRSVTAAFGLATVWLSLSLRRYIGAIGALACAALIAVSPGMVFFSRYYIHEMLFVFFTLGIVVGALRFYEGEGVRRDNEATKGSGTLGLGVAASSIALVVLTLETVYHYATLTRTTTVALLVLILACLVALSLLLLRFDGARSFYLVLASASAALMFATKETAFISAGVLLIAWGMSELWVRIVARTKWARQPEPKRKKGKDKRATQTASSFAPLRLIETFGGWTHIIYLLIAALSVFLFINTIYYSSFFTNPKGVKDAVEALMIWRKTGESGFHGYPFYKFFEWLVFGNYAGEYRFGEEGPLVLLAALGALLAAWKTRRRFPLFAALWGFGLFAAYSIIEYKTPWLALSWLLPLAITGGYAIDKLYRARAQSWRVISLVLVGACLLIAAYQSYQLNFVHYDDDKYPYVYAHTRREFHDLIARMEEITARTPNKYDAGINVAVENQEYWPLPWYIRDYKRIGYTGHVVETSDAVILVKTSQVPQVESLLGNRYVRVGGTYQLRPGVDLALFGRRDLVTP